MVKLTTAMYKGRLLLFNHADLDGETRLEMSGSRALALTKKLKSNFVLV